MRGSFYIFLIILLLLTGACSTTPEQSTGNVPTDGRFSTDTPMTNNAVIALMDSADREINAGNHDSAAVSIERALRLQPKDGLLWYRLGVLRFKQGNWQQAVNLASKSNSLAAGDYSLQAANWRLIAAAMKEMGDDGANEALRKADRLNR